MAKKMLYAVVLYPPIGKPRVVELPELPRGMKYPLQTFENATDAATALESFLVANPEYRTWEDGKLATP